MGMHVMLLTKGSAYDSLICGDYVSICIGLVKRNASLKLYSISAVLLLKWWFE